MNEELNYSVKNSIMKDIDNEQENIDVAATVRGGIQRKWKAKKWKIMLTVE